MIRHVEWSSGWVEAFLRRTTHHKSSSLGDKAAFLIQSVETVIAERRYIDAARMFVSILSHRFGCSHGAISESRRKRMRLLALSQTALFDRKSRLSKAFEAAGDEAADQATALVAPAAGDVAFVFAAQMALSKALDNARVLTVPLVARTDVIGAVTLVRDRSPFNQEEIDLIDALGAAVGPILRDKAETDRALPAIAYDRLRALFEKLFGPRHLGIKIGTAALLGAAIFLTFATDEYRVRARAEVQGEVRRILPAPFDGYIKAQSARAGDVVGEGSVIAELQDNDLVLDRLRHLSRKRQYQFELDKALAKRDLAQINIAQAQIDQADADIELADQMLTRAQVKVPFDSVVVNGDLSQSVGRPVSRGDVLFEIAPLDRYRVTLVVPETDIRLIERGQKGELLLSAFPDQVFPLEVKSITPVSRASDGVNGFEVMAGLAGRDERIRPAMEGIAKIDAGRRSIFWIWTHALVSWKCASKFGASLPDDAPPPPMNARPSIYSPLWHRAESLCLRLRPQTLIERHVVRGEVWYVAKDRLGAHSSRFSPAVYAVLMRMDGVRSLDKIWQETVAQFGENAPAQDQIISLVSQLYAAELVDSDRPVDQGELAVRAETHARRTWRLSAFRIRCSCGFRSSIRTDFSMPRST